MDITCTICHKNIPITELPADFWSDLSTKNLTYLKNIGLIFFNNNNIPQSICDDCLHQTKIFENKEPIPMIESDGTIPKHHQEQSSPIISNIETTEIIKKNEIIQSEDIHHDEIEIHNYQFLSNDKPLKIKILFSNNQPSKQMTTSNWRSILVFGYQQMCDLNKPAFISIVHKNTYGINDGPSARCKNQKLIGRGHIGFDLTSTDIMLKTFTNFIDDYNHVVEEKNTPTFSVYLTIERNEKEIVPDIKPDTQNTKIKPNPIKSIEKYDTYDKANALTHKATIKQIRIKRNNILIQEHKINTCQDITTNIAKYLIDNEFKEINKIITTVKPSWLTQYQPKKNDIPISGNNRNITVFLSSTTTKSYAHAINYAARLIKMINKNLSKNNQIQCDLICQNK